MVQIVAERRFRFIDNLTGYLTLFGTNPHDLSLDEDGIFLPIKYSCPIKNHPVDPLNPI